jgi:hypothetical protein
MYFSPKEHNPPHLHAYYQDSKAIIDIIKGEITDGNLPAKQLKLVSAWVELHKDELFADWQLCQNGEEPFKIDPLK